MIIPAFDIIKSRVVRLYQGNYSKITYYDIDLYHNLQYYSKKGVKIIHLVDLDGAQNSKNKQFKFFKKIISYNIIPIQIGGGIRKEKDIDQLLTLGAKRVIIGSSVIENKNEVKKWISIYGSDSIVLALDINIDDYNNKNILIHGWQKKTNITLEEILNFFSDTELKHILCTDISRDGTLLGPNIPLYIDICKNFKHLNIQSSGGIRSLNDIFNLKDTGVKNIIIGRGLLENKFTIEEALKCWQSE
ncbi:1-(5-phosphoribosyl)-5-[(5-phosphoribosylamino)methylideneamino]imidazole-4-carboxamide isomerase [Buchnera aphidicola]|uniref:1-(5-phosphoribosyl)-5-[(5- phosphoribosylamino)methylideneamino]imidazole-4- carboxamide isomerase n=1 Tax=Buchnera aphidicola TaxID=9 RepID=UPI003BEF2959